MFMSTPNSCWDPVLRWSAVRRWGGRVGCACEGGGLLMELMPLQQSVESSLPLSALQQLKTWGGDGDLQPARVLIRTWPCRPSNLGVPGSRTIGNNSCLLFISHPVLFFFIEAQTKISMLLFIFIFHSICLIISNRTCSLTLVGIRACITEMHAF